MNTQARSIPVGSEISVFYEGRRRRGWVAEQEKTGNTIVRLYPDGGEVGDFEIEEPRQIRLLKRQTLPKGWNAVDMARPDGKPWVSLRFDDHFWNSLLQNAEEQNKTPEEMFKHYLNKGIEAALAEK